MILSFKNHMELSEGFKNFIGEKSLDDRLKYVDRVWDILQSSYAKIGGMFGNGFKNKQDMIDNIPFWKVYERNGEVLVAAMYKDKVGRKAVAYATNGTPAAKKILADVFRSELGVSWGEISKGALLFALKSVNFEVIKPYIMTPANVIKALGDDTIIVPTQKYVDDNLDNADRAVYKKLSMLHDYFYVRIIGGSPHLKVAIGTLDKHIT